MTSFVFGAQYYRAPTPEPECWDADHRRMRELGFNQVKYWAQWRWAHRRGGRMVWDDLDRLMDLAAASSLGVTINTIFDVAPTWLYEAFPDAKPVLADGRVVEPLNLGFRQLGGAPGPCLSHPGARREREVFLAAAVERFRGHPALRSWDVWNEPELCFPQRHPDAKHMACFCRHCQAGFRSWLEHRYQRIDRLNQVWGRCYESWDEIEAPRLTDTLTDFVDWREFHVAVMTGEAAWRLDLARRLDPAHLAYLHVVPNDMACFSTVACATDDPGLAQRCDIWAATCGPRPYQALTFVSAAGGRPCHNVESHINGGMIGMHQARHGYDAVLREYVPQLGLGITGLMFWQYRSEVLGNEAPAWGLVGLDGCDRPVTRAVGDFWQRLQPHAGRLASCRPPATTAAVWKGRRNELFHFAMHQRHDALLAGVRTWSELAYHANFAVGIRTDGQLLAGDLAKLRLLVMPSPYLLDRALAEALAAWVEAGGVLISEAHLGAYDGDNGRHSRIVPGCGLAARLGVRELDSTDPRHLRWSSGESAAIANDDVRKAITGSLGGRFVPLLMDDGSVLWGADRCAFPAAADGEPVASYPDGQPAVLRCRRGRGTLYYAGSDLGAGAERGDAGLRSLLARAAADAGLLPACGAAPELPGSVRVSPLYQDGTLRYVAVSCAADRAQSLRLDALGTWRGVFTDTTWDTGHPVEVPAGFHELFVVG